MEQNQGLEAIILTRFFPWGLKTGRGQGLVENILLPGRMAIVSKQNYRLLD